MERKGIADRLLGRFGDKVSWVEAEAGDPWLRVDAAAILEVAAFAKAEPELLFDNLMCLSAVDYPKEDPPRLEVVYHLLSYAHGHSFVLKAHLPREAPALPSVSGVWRVADWHEREAYDLFGIRFEGHPDLRRILLPDDWSGHPLLKDWEDPDFYNGMRVKPTEQMAERAMKGEEMGVGPFDQTPPNRHATGGE
jgi:NADH-quinone oxidoreductase subunit C